MTDGRTDELSVRRTDGRTGEEAATSPKLGRILHFECCKADFQKKHFSCTTRQKDLGGAWTSLTVSEQPEPHGPHAEDVGGAVRARRGPGGGPGAAPAASAAAAAAAMQAGLPLPLLCLCGPVAGGGGDEGGQHGHGQDGDGGGDALLPDGRRHGHAALPRRDGRRPRRLRRRQLGLQLPATHQAHGGAPDLIELGPDPVDLASTAKAALALALVAVAVCVCGVKDGVGETERERERRGGRGEEEGEIDRSGGRAKTIVSDDDEWW